MNVALSDYDDDTLRHVVELMKDSLREANEIILENTWKVATNQRQLYKNDDGLWESLEHDSLGFTHAEREAQEILEVMTVSLTVQVGESI